MYRTKQNKNDNGQRCLHEVSRDFVGHSQAMAEVREKIRHVAKSECLCVLILGETGTGKETAARMLHAMSALHKGQFRAFNCSGVRPDLLESRFFGHVKGSFTGAIENRPGLFEQANGGTLFLDEIGDLTLEAQGLLLRVLEDGKCMPLGGSEEIEVNENIIAATNRDIHQLVRNYIQTCDSLVEQRSRMFRDDLYQRLCTVIIQLPPLREHKEDIPEIVEYWQQRQSDKEVTRPLSSRQLTALMNYDYPGNVRELFQLLRRAEVLGVRDISRLIDEQRKMFSLPSVSYAFPDDCREMMAMHTRRVFEKYGRNLSVAAEKLGMAKNTLRKWLEG